MKKILFCKILIKLTSILAFDNKTLTISVLFLVTAKYNADIFKLN